jgi:hypothetical protein
MAVDPIIERFSRDLILEHYQGLESSTVNTAPPLFVESLLDHSNRGLPRLALYLHAEEISPTILT